MTMRKPFRLLAALALIAIPAAAAAQSIQQDQAIPLGAANESGHITLGVSQGTLLVLTKPARHVFIADPAIANVQVPDPEHVFIFGKKAGRTNLFVLGAKGNVERSIAIDVRNDTARAQQLTGVPAGAREIHIGSVANGLVLEGKADDPASAALAQDAARENVPEKSVIDDRVKIRNPVQVTLRVRIAEVSRTVTKQLGINWNAVMQAGSFQYGLFTGRSLFTGGLAGGGSFLPAPPLQGAAQPGSLIAGFNTSGGGINAVIDALSEEGLVTILAEPNLTAISGETASFLAGGEFPIPVSQALGVTTIEFKSFGVSLKFVPTVMSANHISLRVKPEVSQISSQGAITVGGLQIPALTVRRADTTIELGSGQSFAIAGLLQNNSNNDIQRFPGLGDLPVLGALFRSTTYQHNESELLIIVTPYIVRPIDDPKSVRLPTDSWRAATDIERVFDGRVASPHPGNRAVTLPRVGRRDAAPHLLGAAGFEIE